MSNLLPIHSWLISRPTPECEETATVSPPEDLRRTIGFPDLILEKIGPQHQDGIVFSYDNITLKPKSWTELIHLVTWSNEFLSLVKNNLESLAALELLRGQHEFPISVAKFHVGEAINVINSALSFDIALDIQHPSTRGQNYAVHTLLVEDSTGVHEIVRQIFACLYSKSVIRLVVKTNHFYSSALTAYLVDLMHQAGATSTEVKCVALDRRESHGGEKFSRSIPPAAASKLSVIATVFKQTDTFAAAQGIIDSYFREQYPNLIVLVEESVHERFVKDWQRYYSHAVHIGSRLDIRTTIVESLNNKVQIDLAAIDIKSSHKMTGNVINVLKFRNLAELLSLLSNIRKVPYWTVWNDDILLSREFCLRLNSCNEFWLNHIPKSLAGRKFPNDILNFYYETVADDMANIYSSVYSQFAEEAEQLRKLQVNFMKKDSSFRSSLILQAFTSMVNKHKSLKNGASVSESVAHLMQFYQRALHRTDSLSPGDSRVEIILKPVGLALLVIREGDSPIKSKAALVELIFKNLLIGNAVLLACPANTLGTRFTFDNDNVIPFKMIHESLPDLSRLSLDESVSNANETSMSKKMCPKNTYAVEISPDLNSENVEAITLALGARRKCIWYADVAQANYWSEE